MGSQPIADLSVQISGDFSKLDQDLAQSIIAAELGGQKIASAFTTAASGADKLDTAMEALTQQISSTGGELVKWDEVSAKTAQSTVQAAGGIDKMTQAAQAATPPITSIIDALKSQESAVKTADEAWKNLGTSLRATGQLMSESGKLIGAAFLPIAAAMAGAVKAASDFELEMRKVTSLMGNVADKDFSDLSNAALELSRRLGVDAVQSAKALYEAISAGVPKENAISFLETASTAAIAGVTNTKVAVDALTTVLNAYHLEASKTREVSDAMFMAVNLGKFNFEQLAASMGKTSGFAAELGISFQEVLAAATSISLQGFTVSQAMTQIQAAMKAIVAPNKEMNAVLHQTGYESGQAMLAALGFEGSLQKIRQIVGDNDAAMAKAFGRIEGFKGLLALTGENAAVAAEHLDKIKTASDGVGAAMTAANEINKSTARQWEILKTQFKDSAIAFGDSLLPVLKEFAPLAKNLSEGAASAAKAFSELSPEARKAAVEITAVGVAVSALLLAGGGLLTAAARIAAAIGTIATAANGATTAVLGFSGALAGLATATVTASLIETGKNLLDLKNKWDDVAQASKNAFVLDQISHGKTLDDLKKLGLGIDDVKKAFQGSAIATKDAGEKWDDYGVHVVKADTAVKKLGGTHTATAEEIKAALKQIELGYKNWDKGLGDAVGSIGATLGLASAYFNEGSRTIIQTFADQGKAFQEYIIAESKGMDKQHAAFEVFQRDVKDVYPEITKLATELGHFPTLSEQVAAGLDRIVGNLNKIKTEGGGALDALIESGKSTVQIVTDLNQVVSETGTVLSSMGQAGVSAFQSMDAAIKQANADFKDWATGVGSFSSQLGILDQQAGGKGRRGGPGTTNAQGDFNTGVSLPPHTHLDYSFWGISGAKVVPDNGYYFDINGNVIEADWHILANGGTIPGMESPSASTPGVASPVAAAPVATAPALPPQVQYLLSQGFTLDQMVTGIDTLNTTLDQSADKISAAVTTLAPVIDAAASAITQSSDAQTAAYSRLSEALAPAAVPQVNAGTPAAFQQLVPANRTLSVTGASGTPQTVNITAAPQLGTLLNQMMEELQRMGIRF